MHDDVSRLRQHLGGICRNFYSPRRMRGAYDLAQIAPGLGRVGVDRADDFHRLLFAQQAHDGGADRSDAVLDGANLFSHDELHGCPEGIGTRTGSMRANTIKETTTSFNQIPRPTHRRRRALPAAPRSPTIFRLR